MNSKRSTRLSPIKGVVYNEMKGNYSSPDNVLDGWSQRSLFPTRPMGSIRAATQDIFPI